MDVLVSGPTGFLGSHLVERLSAAGHRVRALLYGPVRHGIEDNPAVELVEGDLTHPASLETALKSVQIVFHTAALVSNWAPWSRFHAVTVAGTENLLDGAIRARVQRFVHISTIRVYDDRFCRRHRLVTEDAPHGKRGFRPFGHYARAKLMAEAAVWRACTRLPVTVIRPAWIYGPRDETIIPAVVRFLKSPNARWPSYWDACADPIYVTDVADCAIAAAVAPAAVGNAYHAAPAERIGVRTFLGLLCCELGFAPPVRSLPYPFSAAAARFCEWWACLTRNRRAPTYNRAGLAILTEDVRHSPEKAQRHFGWQASVDLEDGVNRTAAWLRKRFPELSNRRNQYANTAEGV